MSEDIDFEEYVREYEAIVETINNLTERCKRMKESNPFCKKVFDFYRKFIEPMRTPRYYIGEAYSLFQKLRPFAYRRTVIRIDDEEFGWRLDALSVGRDIRIGEYYSLRTDRIGHSLSEPEFIKVVSKYYREIVPHLRRPIRETFEELAKLTEELELSLTITQGCEGYFYYDDSSWRGYQKIPCKEISVSVSERAYPEYIHITCIGRSTRHTRISDSGELFALYKPIYEAYRKFHEEWSKIQKKNDEILEKMRKVLGEYALVNNL